MQIDLAPFAGRLPYSAQYVGTYQPLLGWTSRTSERWVSLQVCRVLAGLTERIVKDLTRLKGTQFGGAEGDSGSAPKMLLENDYIWLFPALKSEAGQASIPQIQQQQSFAALRAAVDAWQPPKQKSLLARLGARAAKAAGVRSSAAGTSTSIEVRAQGLKAVLAAVAQEPGLSAFLERGFQKQQLSYDDTVRWANSLTRISETREQYLLSPIGQLDLFRHYFFELDPFLGPPEQHIWQAPYSTTELIEAFSQSDLTFFESERTHEIASTSETATTERVEFSEEVGRETQEDIRVAQTGEGGVNFAVWHAGGATAIDYATNLQNSKTVARNNSRETTTKVAQKLTRTFRALTRESREIRRSHSRRHVIRNRSARVVNIQLRRKLRVVCVQAQHIATQLCWQLYIDNPGHDLGLSELVHIAKPEDFDNVPPPDAAPPSFPTLESTFVCEVPFQALSDEDGDRNADSNETYNWGHHGDNNHIQSTFRFTAPIPQPGYQLVAVSQKGYEGTSSDYSQPSKWSVGYFVSNAATGEFGVNLNQVNFEKQPSVQVTVGLVWGVKDDVRRAAEDNYRATMDQYNQKMQREAQRAMVAAVRERVELARGIEPRPTDDLRDEERTVLFRALMRRLTDDAVATDDVHVMAEFLRGMFDLDKMLYFVAPDWWNPKAVPSGGGLTVPDVPTPTPSPSEAGFIGTAAMSWSAVADVANNSITLGPSQRVRFGGPAANRENNYLITENSEPAALGSSIGWLLQLDGDAHRNAFLNAAWAQLVVPIRPGHEIDAIHWLTQAHVEDAKGLDAELIGADGNRIPLVDANGVPVLDANGDVVNRTVGDALIELAQTVKTQADTDQGFLAKTTVYETGFVPLPGSFPITGTPQETFAQWIEIVPTDQIVAEEVTVGADGRLFPTP